LYINIVKMRYLFNFFSGITLGVYLAQTYRLPDIKQYSSEMYNIFRSELKSIARDVQPSNEFPTKEDVPKSN
jgi:hypothetical protein